ncbi:MAG TPA: GNAT family N-acetyltransferase [Gemmatimonadales bacterium]|nr:GNAT family N-acetyltransferase [Gemmatimonadales bacterium]
MPIEIIVLGPGDESVLASVAPGVFDHPVQPRLSTEFLNDPRHHLAVAIDAGCVVGFASAVHYVHPDKALELWINEVGVAPTHKRRGLGKKLLQTLLELGGRLGCQEAWVTTDRTNRPAMQLYASVGGTESPGETVAFSFVLDGAGPA